MRDWTVEENYTAVGYLKYALEHYNECSERNELPKLTDEQVAKIVSCMHYAFDMLTEDEALKRG